MYRTPAEFESFAGFITTSLSWLQNETSEQMPMFFVFNIQHSVFVVGSWDFKQQLLSDMT